jgi:hypothetical protein
MEEMCASAQFGLAVRMVRLALVECLAFLVPVLLLAAGSQDDKTHGQTRPQ